MKARLRIAGLIWIVAAMCVSGWAAARQANVTEIAGGSGGDAFSDSGTGQGARVVEVQVRSSEYVDSVQFVYMLPDGRTVMGPQHGGTGGRLSVFDLDADEYLVGISGRSGSYIDSIQFLTNKRTSPAFGGGGGDRDFSVDVPAGARVTGLTGRSGEYLDAVGLVFSPIRRGFSSDLDRAPQPGQTSVEGGPGGTAFVDGDIPEGARVVEVRLRSGEYIDSVQMIYRLPDGRLLEGVVHGGDGGRAESFRLEPDEYIIGLSGRCGDYVDSLRIRTNLRNSEVFGGSGGSRDFRIEVPDDNRGTGFMGRSGEYLDAIGLAYVRTRARQRRFREDRRDR